MSSIPQVVTATEKFTVRSASGRVQYSPDEDAVRMHVMAEALLADVCRASGRMNGNYTAAEYLQAYEQAAEKLGEAV